MSEPEFIHLPDGRYRVVERFLVSRPRDLETLEQQRARLKVGRAAKLLEYTAVRVVRV